MEFRAIIWGAVILAAAGAGVVVWAAARIGASSDQRLSEEPVENRKEPTLPS